MLYNLQTFLLNDLIFMIIQYIPDVDFTYTKVTFCDSSMRTEVIQDCSKNTQQIEIYFLCYSNK